MRWIERILGKVGNLWCRQCPRCSSNDTMLMEEVDEG